ncbi:MAG: insulinase family protein, partial [Simkania negevensis]|nr:insulinase family protein [Simkania negevensis]
MKQKAQYQVGNHYKEFVFTKVLPIEELELTLYELEHETSGAKVMHLESDDKENLFCISFKTLPDSSNGAPHILEHTVLCGSKKFPVKDPFFSMNRRSLNTFMNAMTGDDFTCYPAASQVEKDFYNLFEVYLDAVFFPELKEMSFMQEG